MLQSASLAPSLQVIPFLKTYVNLPGAVAFTVIYSNMSNRMPQSQVFYTLLSVFLTFFGMFALFLYPNRGFLHPHIAADNLAAMLPGSFSAPISIFRNWTFALFYLMAEMWGSVVVSILFWGLANQICTVKEVLPPPHAPSPCNHAWFGPGLGTLSGRSYRRQAINRIVLNDGG